MARPCESAPGHAQDVFFLQESNELDVVGKRAFGEKIKSPLRDCQFVAELRESANEPVSFGLVDIDVHADSLEFHYEPLHESGRVYEAENPVGQRERIDDFVSHPRRRD